MIKDYLIKQQESGEMSEDDYAPEVTLPPDYQRRDQLEKWWQPLDKAMTSTNKPYGGNNGKDALQKSL